MSATSVAIRVHGRPTLAAPQRTRSRAQAPRGVSAPTPSVHLTRRGRLVITAALTMLIVAGFVVFGGTSVATRDAGSVEAVRVVEVEQGQTLWSIAGAVAEPGETREMVYRIRELNSLPSSALVEGQELAVPIG